MSIICARTTNCNLAGSPQAVRVPHPVNLRSGGINAERRGQWVPRKHADPFPSGRESPADWAVRPTQSVRATPYNGRGAVSAHAALVLGCAAIPGCSHMWRLIGPESERTSRYSADLNWEFSDKEWRPLALEGGHLIRQYGGLYHAFVSLHDSEIRHLAPQLEYPRPIRESFPSQYPAAVGILDLDHFERAEYP